MQYRFLSPSQGKGRKWRLFTPSNACTGRGCCSGTARSVMRRYEEVAQGPVSLGVKADVITDEADWLRSLEKPLLASSEHQNHRAQRAGVRGLGLGWRTSAHLRNLMSLQLIYSHSHFIKHKRPLLSTYYVWPRRKSKHESISSASRSLRTLCVGFTITQPLRKHVVLNH